MTAARRLGSSRLRSLSFIIATLLCTSLLCVALPSNSRIATSEFPNQAAISVTTELVVLPVNVTDSHGAFVSGLQKKNFHVYEDGKPQNVSLFAEEDTPVTVGLLVDQSRSMGPKLSDVVIAVSTFVLSSHPEDEMFVVDFSDDVSIASLDGKPFTSDTKILENAILAVSARGRTALYDAVAAGLTHLELGHREKKALVIVSDGGDNASRHKYGDILNLAKQAHAIIYSIVLAGNSQEEENPRALERLCKVTGGIAFLPRADQKTADDAKAIARDLREQYTLGYAPMKKAGGNSYRKTAVKVDAPHLGPLRVRTRAGYLARSEKASTPQTQGGRQ